MLGKRPREGKGVVEASCGYGPAGNKYRVALTGWMSTCDAISDQLVDERIRRAS